MTACDARLDGVRKALRRRKLDALVVTAAANVRYLSGFTGQQRYPAGLRNRSGALHGPALPDPGRAADALRSRGVPRAARARGGGASQTQAFGEGGLRGRADQL